MGEQLPLIDTTCRPTVEPPPGATPVGPPEMCSKCGAFSTPYSVLGDDPLSNGIIDHERREPLCLDCTIETARRFEAEGKHVAPSIRKWAGLDVVPSIVCDGCGATVVCEPRTLARHVRCLVKCSACGEKHKLGDPTCLDTEVSCG